MFSKRLCRYFKFLNWLTLHSGAIAARYNNTTKLYQYGPGLTYKVNFHYGLFATWICGGFFKVLKYYLQKDVNQTNVALSFWLTGILALVLYSALCFFSHDICIMINGFSQLMTYIHRKYIYISLYTSNF